MALAHSEEKYPASGRAAARLLRPFQEFARLEAAGGILLLGSAVLALVWANSAWAGAYEALWATRVTVGFGDALLSKPLLLWINDGLMAVFFFVVGLEIKREVLVGELASPRQAALPMAGAVGGMLAPALFYAAVNAGGPGMRGWGIPMATDIAFALGVLALLGRRVPLPLKIFLTALAIVDDLGAVLVIALFYTEQIAWGSLAVGIVFLALLAGANRLGVRHPGVYGLFGVVVWLAFLKSGVHATVAGVLVAMTIPSWTLLNPEEFLARSRAVLDNFSQAGARGGAVVTNHERQAALYTLESGVEAVTPPLQRIEHALHPWVTFLILPVFALANAGVELGGGEAAFGGPVVSGVILGLVLGKPAGIVFSSWVAVRLGLAALPAGVRWGQILGLGCLGGIGFTMSLFIAGLAFGDSPLLTQAKVGILAASLAAGLAGGLLLWRAGGAAPVEGERGQTR